MADIKIGNLQIAGIDLFGDSESFLKDLQDGDLGLIQGGRAGSVVTNGCTVVAGCIQTK
jgi:hypothetical protein